ncbi:MAG TPA: hypothetical protein VEQ67_00620, partial [Mycobacterium sp.]|nr:hypothetical protein [Mycobacterium sp.]
MTLGTSGDVARERLRMKARNSGRQHADQQPRLVIGYRPNLIDTIARWPSASATRCDPGTS